MTGPSDQVVNDPLATSAWLVGYRRASTLPPLPEGRMIPRLRDWVPRATLLSAVSVSDN
jgi:hypothetical protein